MVDQHPEAFFESEPMVTHLYYVLLKVKNKKGLPPEGHGSDMT